MEISVVTPTGCYVVDGVVNNAPLSLLVDTGAAITLIQIETWDGYAQRWIAVCSRGVNGGLLGWEVRPPSGVSCHIVGAYLEE